MKTNRSVSLGEKIALRSVHGPVSFGLVVSNTLVSWSDAGAKDLLIHQLGNGFYLYPTRRLDDAELTAAPVHLCPSQWYGEYAAAADWNRDGREDLIIGVREGFLWYLESRGRYPQLALAPAGPVRNRDTGLMFNIPYQNPNHPELDELGGYFDTEFFNNPHPLVYPLADPHRINLIIGDWAGQLWWLPDVGAGDAPPEYRGVPYEIPPAKIQSRFGKQLIEKHGCRYVRPAERLCDETGQPFSLGDSIDSGTYYQGAYTRPVLYRNRVTGSNDLMVLAGGAGSGISQHLHYLQRVGDSGGAPVFRDLGEIGLGLDSREAAQSSQNPVTTMTSGRLTCHSVLIVAENDGWNDLLISMGTMMAVFRNKRQEDAKPAFVFDRMVSGRDAITGGYNYTEILSDIEGRRFLLDNPWGSNLVLREIVRSNQDVRLTPSTDTITVQDQSGSFWMESETDPNDQKSGGFHRACRWDFDGSERQHLIVGTDRGLLYLLVEECPLGTGGDYRYKSAGPLKDSEGKVIKVHNRACAGGIDLNGDGSEDLVVGGVSYQKGIETDPNPGGGFYYLLNTGLDQDGLPVLAPMRPLPVQGHEFDFYVNSHVQIQTGVFDFTGVGTKQLLLAVQRDGFQGMIFEPCSDGEDICVRYTGVMLPKLSIDDRLLDIDADGRLEFVFGGGEQGVAYYRKIIG